MKEFFEAINLYPWTTFFIYIMIASILSIFKSTNK